MTGNSADGVIVVGAPPKSKVIKSCPGVAFANKMAFLRLHGFDPKQSPASVVLVTVKLCASTLSTMDGTVVPFRSTTKSDKASTFKRIGKTACTSPSTSNEATAN